MLVIFTRFHSTTDPEIKDLVDLGFRVPSGIVPESNPQASPGTCYLRQRRWEWGGAQAESQLCHVQLSPWTGLPKPQPSYQVG